MPARLQLLAGEITEETRLPLRLVLLLLSFAAGGGVSLGAAWYDLKGRLDRVEAHLTVVDAQLEHIWAQRERTER